MTEVDGRNHNGRCERSRKKVCKCRCNGRFHGKDAFESRNDPNDKPMYREMGGEIETFLRSVEGKTMSCWCGSELVCGGFLGYPHDNGLADMHGNKFWLFLKCDKCNYDWSAWKVESRARDVRQQVLEARL